MKYVSCLLCVVGCKNKAAGLFYNSFNAVPGAASCFRNPLLGFGLFHE